MTPTLYQIPLNGRGRLSLMACPPADHLEMTLAALRAQGADVIVSLLTVEDAQRLGVAEEKALCEATGLTFASYPIVDFGVPDIAPFRVVIDDIVSRLNAGQHIVVHCRAGIGRSGMLAVCILIALGATPAAAIEIVSQARGVPVPETLAQHAFIQAFAAP